MRTRNYSFEDQREKYHAAPGVIWNRGMVEDPNLEGTVFLTNGPGIQIKLSGGFYFNNNGEKEPCMLILSNRPQRIPSLLWNEFHRKMGPAEERWEIFSVEIEEIKDGAPIVRVISGLPWRWIKFEELDESPT